MSRSASSPVPPRLRKFAVPGLYLSTTIELRGLLKRLACFVGWLFLGTTKCTGPRLHGSLFVALFERQLVEKSETIPVKELLKTKNAILAKSWLHIEFEGVKFDPASVMGKFLVSVGGPYLHVHGFGPDERLAIVTIRKPAWGVRTRLGHHRYTQRCC